MIASCCYNCVHYYDDGSCHRYPLVTVEQDVSYNLVSHGPKVTRSGKPVTCFPIVCDWWVCGEYEDRCGLEPMHAMTSDELFDAVMREHGPAREEAVE